MSPKDSNNDKAHFDDRRKRFQWLSWEMFVQTVFIGIACLSGFYNVKSDVRDANTHIEINTGDIKQLKESRKEDHDLLLELRGDIKYVRQTLEQDRR